MTVYGIFGSSNLKDVTTKYAPVIEQIIKDPNVEFIFNDNDILIARYMKQRGFRKCTVYHVGDSPKHNIGKFKTKGGFESDIDIKAAIVLDAHKIISHL